MSSPAPSGFNPELFLNATVSEVNTKRPPLPEENPAREDGCYIAVCQQPKMVSGTIEKGEKIGQPWLMAEIPLLVEVPQQVQDMLGLKLEKGTMQFTDRAFIDLTPQKTIDNSPGKNRRQRQYREALDLNKPGDTWSWAKVTGQPVKVKIKWELYNGETQERLDLILKP